MPRWCGTRRSTDDWQHAVDNGPWRYHAVYLTASDTRNRFRISAPVIQVDALGASALLERTYQRAIRFDMGTDCGPAFLDITLVRSPATAAEFRAAAQRPLGTLDLVRRSLTSLMSERPDWNYVVWIDAPAERGACGQGEGFTDPRRSQDNWNNQGGRFALVFRPGGRFCGAATVRHEIGHTLGALQPDAPNSGRGAHCHDAYEDTMCYPDAPVRDDGQWEGEYFDYRNDDYWDPPHGKPLDWWTVNLSRFLCQAAGCNRPTHAPEPRFNY